MQCRRARRLLPLKEVKEELKGLKKGIRALMKAQGLTVESAPLLAEDV